MIYWVKKVFNFLVLSIESESLNLKRKLSHCSRCFGSWGCFTARMTSMCLLDPAHRCHQCRATHGQRRRLHSVPGCNSCQLLAAPCDAAERQQTKRSCTKKVKRVKRSTMFIKVQFSNQADIVVTSSTAEPGTEASAALEANAVEHAWLLSPPMSVPVKTRPVSCAPDRCKESTLGRRRSHQREVTQASPGAGSCDPKPGTRWAGPCGP